jgi:hypothetical protein
VAHVNSSFNNTKILISDVQGNAISWSSAGTMGFKGSRKSTPYAAQMAAEDAGRKAQEHGVKTLEVEVQGPGSGPGKRAARAGRRRLQHHVDPRRDPDRAQRLPPAEAPPRLRPHFAGCADAWPATVILNLGRPPLLDMGSGQEWRRRMIHKNWQN